MKKCIYIADDEKNIRQLIQSFLVKEGFDAQCFADGASLLDAFEKQEPDLIVLDVMMPGMDGLSVCSMIRQKSAVPIIIVSAKDGPLDKVAGLTLGSDDYMVKPFLPLELVTRIKALLRRVEMSAKSAPPSAVLRYNSLCLNTNLRTAQVGEKEFAVTPTEFNFLEYLMKNSERAISRDELLNVLWQFPADTGDTRAADDLVKRLRKKLRALDSDVRIETVWGFGFRLERVEDPF